MSGRKVIAVACLAYLSSRSLVSAEEIIGFDGVEHEYARGHHHHVAADPSQPKMHAVHHHHVSHMLNADRGHHKTHSVKSAGHGAQAAHQVKKEESVKVHEDLIAQAAEEAVLENSMEVLRAQLCVRRSKAGTKWHGHDHHKCDEFMTGKCDDANKEKAGKAMRIACQSFFADRKSVV